jgi:hypothetical protein
MLLCLFLGKGKEARKKRRLFEAVFKLLPAAGHLGVH